MQFVKNVFVAAAALAVGFGAQAQTADEIIAKHVTAIGGMEKLKGINSLYVEGDGEVMGNTITSTTTILNKKGFRSEGEAMGSKIIQVFTDKDGWSVTPMTGTEPMALPEEAVKMAQDQLDIAGPLVDYAAKGNKVELQGQEKVGAANAYKLQLTNKAGFVTTYYIDPATFYIVKMTRSGNMMGQEMNIAITYGDYRKTDYGFVYPYTMDTDMGQFAISAKVKKVEVNKPVDEKIFAMPK